MTYALHLPGVTLVPVVAGRAAELRTLIVEAEAQRYFAGAETMDLSRLEQLAAERGGVGGRGRGLWIIESERDGTVGLCGVWRVQGVAASHPSMQGGRESMVALAPRARGRGIATQSLRAISQFITANVRIKRLVATAEPAHAAAQRMLTRSAYQMMGRLADQQQPLMLYERIYGLGSKVRYEDP